MAVGIMVNPNMITSIPNQKYEIFSVKPQIGSKIFLKSTFFDYFHEILIFEN